MIYITFTLSRANASQNELFGTDASYREGWVVNPDNIPFEL